MNFLPLFAAQNFPRIENEKKNFIAQSSPFVLSSLVNAKPIEKTETAEIVIIGAGAAGLFAAVAAKENGAGRVVLIEKNPSPFFSSTSYSAGSDERVRHHWRS